jgi:hypothetical protein
MGHLHQFRFEIEDLVWTSLGVHPDGAVEIHATPQGVVEKIYMRSTGDALTQLEIPKNHSLFRSLTVTKPFTVAA